MLDKQPIRPICIECNKNPARKNGVSVRGFQLWHKLCNLCAKKRYVQPIKKDSTCSSCGFVAVDSCQLDLVDDRTICACCHRLEIKHENERKRNERQITVDATVGLDDYTL
jgi:ribosomal protein L37E